ESLAKRRPSGRSLTKLTRAQPAGETSWSAGRIPRVSGRRTRSLTSTARPFFSIGVGIGLLVIGMLVICASLAPAIQSERSGMMKSGIRVRMETSQCFGKGKIIPDSLYLTGGLPNLAASIATFVFISFSFAVYLPSSQENLYSNGNLIPAT